jgi:solute carrier family 25 S-adenosylmethionine transporter 26
MASLLVTVNYLFLFFRFQTQAWHPSSSRNQRQRRSFRVILPSLYQSSVDATALSRERLGEMTTPSSSTTDDTNSLVLPPPPAPSVTVPLIQLALAGSVTTFLADAVIHPIDCIKTFQQQQQQLDSGMTFLASAVYLWHTGGLFQGLWTYAASDAIGGALKFSVWEAWKASSLSVLRRYNFVGAALAFGTASIAVAPGEFLKQQLQMTNFASLGEAVMSIYAQDGISGFFVGYDAIVLRDIPHTMLELCLYDSFKRFSTSLPSFVLSSRGNGSKSHNEAEKQVQPVVAAGGTGCVAGFLTTPMDTLKTQVMESGHDTSIAECLQHTLDVSGWAGLWAGALARVLWIAPFTMLYLPTYDLLHKYLKERHVHKLEQ